jgi:serine/threonine-protein kinase
MITRGGIAKLCDLGLARNAATRAGSGMTTEEAVGTPNYVSPEQARGAEEVDARTDIYSLGASLYHLATGVMPFKKLGSPLVVMARHLTEKIDHPRKIQPALSEGFCKIMTRMMAKDPEHRYATAGELLDDLILVRAGDSPRNAETTGVSTVADR